MKRAIALFHCCILGAVLACFPASMLAAGAREISAPPPQKRQPLDAFRLNMMIRNAIIALNQANITGNYTVLRDLGTPAFQRGNDSARLAIMFAELRSKAADFRPVFFINPTLVQQPSMDRNGVLRLTGFFPTQPERIVFDIGYQQVDGKWGLAELTVDVQPVPVEEANALETALKAAAAAVNSSQKTPQGGKAGSSIGAVKNKKKRARDSAD